MSSVSDGSSSIQQLTSDGSILLAAKGGSIVLVGKVFSYALRLLIGIMLTRFLGAEKFGLYRLAQSAGEIGAGFAMLGLQFAFVRFISLYASRRDSPRLWGTIQVGMGLVTVISLLIGLCLFAFATPIATHLFNETRLIPLLRIASLIVPFLALSNALVSTTRGFNKMHYSIISQEIAQPMVRVILLALIALIGMNVAYALGTYIAGIITAFVLLLYFLNRVFPLKRPLNTAVRDVKGILRFSLPAYFSVLIDTFQSNIRTILLGSLNTVLSVGVFSVAAQVSAISRIFNLSVGTVSSPIVSELQDQGDEKRIAKFYQTMTKWMFTLNLPIFLIIMLFSEMILSIFGEDFRGGTAVLAIMICSNLVVASAGIAGGVLNMSGYTSLRLFNSIIHIALTLILSFLLIPNWGAIGAAFTVLTTNSVVNLLRVTQVFIKFKMLPYNLSYFKPVAAGLVALSVGWITRGYFHTESNLVMAVLNAIEIVAVYVGVILILGLSPEDRVVVASIQKRIRSGLLKR